MMQLGTRWPVDGETPPRLPDSVVAAVRDVETELMDTDTTNWRWTLTWLEGKPVVELDDGTVIRVAPDGSAVVTPA
ncbi:MAG: hypothetical protein JWN80_177 [Microbacteriaceae bacterium]|jgi:hypothetical protein|nr:hypothetical protein [Microbacteriaceae bacterium]